jgi:hypothetical protein
MKASIRLEFGRLFQTAQGGQWLPVSAGVGLPVLMKLLGHTSPEMTMRYLVALTDLQREFQLARSRPRSPGSPAEGAARPPSKRVRRSG